jgi:CheY-like chemotaxis protein
MPEGGVLAFRAANAILDEKYCAAHPDAKPGDYVLLSVSDTGEGMTEETRGRLFEPFFTTKEVGKGTGLGLAMVYGIVKQHGGHIRVLSRVGVGSEFRIYFPVLVGEETPEIRPLQTMAKGGRETILLVEDDPAVRNLGVRVLEKSGYKVVTAENGRDALEIYGRMSAAVSLVILDLIMPEMSGKQCLERLIAINPRVKVLIASGFSADGLSREDFGPLVKGFLSKPFDLGQLRSVVRDALDAD